MRIEERNQRESERIFRSITDNELERQEEMMLEFDQSALSQNLIGCYNTVYVPNDQTSNGSYSDCDFFDTNPTLDKVTSSLDKTPTPHLKSISDRVHTPARLLSPLELMDINLSFSQDV